MDNRKIVIVQWNKNSLAKNIINSLPTNFDVVIFQKHDLTETYDNHIQLVKMPINIDTTVKSKNYIIQYYKQLNHKGMLHIIEDTVEILKDPTEFINDIERLMILLDINSYLGTVTDACNRIYSKYNPRLRLINDKPEWQKLNFKDIIFCSHSNVHWMIFNLALADEQELTFNEIFSIEMFWIIEYLARRRNTHPNSLYLMNQYVTCGSEYGVYRNCGTNSSDKTEQNEKIKYEDELFKSLNIDYHPDNNIDMLLERIAVKLTSKL